MAKIDAYVPEPKTEYDVSQQRQTLDALKYIDQSIKLWLSKRFKR
jgi:hypothetical protein